MSNSNGETFLRAEPTKDFFILMLVKDIDLIPAIVDLVDNSIDGARRVRPNGDFDGLWIRLEVSVDQLRIDDNCGGISLDVARDYAFRFGRPAEAGHDPRSIGQFGVGMKRALFKLGKRFLVESRTVENRWKLEVDVDQWREETEWQFRLAELSHEGVPLGQTGTTITVAPLHESVRRDFELDYFQNELGDDIRKRHQESMQKGLSISLNRLPVDFDPLQLLSSGELKPAYQELTFEGSPPVYVKMYAGVEKSSPQQAGWYVYCNGRLVLGPDKGSVTGWGAGMGKQIPRFHNQFAMFRGYVFFDTDDASRLPWTTTKTGVDANSEIYRSVRQRMINMMRPVIDFLNLLDRERELKEDEEEVVQSLERTVEQAPLVGIDDLEPSSQFSYPKRSQRPSQPRTQSIQYRRPVEQIDAVKRALGVTSAGKAGEGTFDYFYTQESEYTQELEPE